MRARLETTPRLSKTRFLSGCQCPLKLWYDCYQAELTPPPDRILQASFEQGREIGALARKRYPGGRLVDWDYQHRGVQALELTQTLIEDTSVSAIYEAAFAYRGVMVRVDILERAPEGGWNLIEVKSGTRAKEIHDLDVGIQTWVLHGAGVDLNRVGVLTLNRHYVFDGVTLDLDALFVFRDRSDVVEERLNEISDRVRALHGVVTSDRAPRITPGPHCERPYGCGYYAHCTRDMVLVQNPISDLPHLHGKKRAELESLGIFEIPQVPDDYPLNALQRTVRHSVMNDCEHISPALARVLRAVDYPLYYLDFETFAPAIPRFAGTRPYSQIPFQFSVHKQMDDGTISHHEFLARGDDDPRPALARALVETLSTHGTVCAYSNYERKVIRRLALDVPALMEPLEGVLERVWDLHAVIRAHYYHPAFHGSFSIKQVLPALLPGRNYEALAISDGRAAALAYEQSLKMDDNGERIRIYNALREYCAQDTFSMVELRSLLLKKTGDTA